jgi:hypothetical protein
LTCIKPIIAPRAIVHSRGSSMRRFAMKALFTALSLSREERKRVDWDRNVLILSTVVTASLIALYVFGKVTSRW